MSSFVVASFEKWYRRLLQRQGTEAATLCTKVLETLNNELDSSILLPLRSKYVEAFSMLAKNIFCVYYYFYCYNIGQVVLRSFRLAKVGVGLLPSEVARSH